LHLDGRSWTKFTGDHVRRFTVGLERGPSPTV
jgi:hypothetical protein